jgi:hypothetical protein
MKYIANPVVVDAWKITSVGTIVAGDLYLEMENNGHMYASREMCARMTPKVGDYVVMQSDQYVYLNPKDVFERKYRMMQEEKLPGAI